MKKVFLFFLIALPFICIGQPAAKPGNRVSIRTTGDATVLDPHVTVPNSLTIPRWADTTAANAVNAKGVDSSGKMFYSYNTKSVWLRQHNPKKWVEIAGSSIASIPMWYNIKTNGADNTGNSDVSSLVNAAINAGFKDIYIPKGAYLLTSSIQLKDSVMIQGDGRGLSKIVVNSNIKAIVAGNANGGYGSQIKDILILGNKSGGATSAQTGIFIDSVAKILVSNVFVSNIGGAGIHIKRNGYCCGTYTQTATRGNIISNCYVENSGIGAFMDTVAEYNNIIGSTFHGNVIGVQISGGNNSITGCNITYSSSKGLYLTGGSNNGHGLVSACTINHNSKSFYVDGATLGVSMTGCNIFSDDSIVVKNSSNVNIVGGWIYAGVIYYDNNTYCTINATNRLSGSEPIITVGTGESPTYIKAGKTNNALSWIDSKNSTEFRIGQTNGVVTFTGLGTAGIDTSGFKPLGINTSTKEVKPLTYWPGGGGSTVTASNGLTKTGSDIALGGALTGNTAITYGTGSTLSLLNSNGGYSLNTVSGGGTVSQVLDHSISPPNHRVLVQNVGGSLNLVSTHNIDSVLLSANGTLISSFGRNGNIRFGVGGVTQIADSSTNKPLTIDATGNIRKGYWFGSSGGGGTNYWTLGSGNLYNNSGTNVGIGTTTPAYTLDVAGNINFTGSVYNNGSKWLHSTGVNGNTFLGQGAGAANTLGSFNIGIGYEAFNSANTTNLQNSIAIGFQAMKNATGTGAATNAIAIGANALDSFQTGFSPIGIGKLNNSRYKTGTGLVSVGASINYLSGDFNTTLGSDQFQLGTGLNGNYNVTIGGQIANYKTSGSSNVYIGYASALNNISGDNTTAVGVYSGSRGNTSYSTYLGAFAGSRSSGNLRVMIDGLDRGDSANEVNNSLLIGQLSFGGASGQSLRINGGLRATNLNTGIPSGAKRLLIGTDGTFYAADTTSSGGGGGSSWFTTGDNSTTGRVGVGTTSLYTDAALSIKSTTNGIDDGITVKANNETVQAKFGWGGITTSFTGSYFSASTASFGTTGAATTSLYTNNLSRLSISSAGAVTIPDLSTNGYVKATGGTGLLSTSATIPGSDITGNISGNASGITGSIAQSQVNSLVSDLSGKQPLNTNLTSIGGLANASGYLFNNGSGTFSYQTPAGSGDMVLASAQTNTGAKTFNNNTLLLVNPTNGTSTLNSDFFGSETQTLASHDGYNRKWWVVPNTTTTVLTIGTVAATVVGTLSTPAITSTNRLTQTVRTSYNTGATAGTVASVRIPATQIWRGNAAGLGGFRYVSYFGLTALQAGNRAFVGIADVTTAPTNVDPTTNTTPGKVGMAINANTGNWQFVTNVTGTAPTVTDLGVNFAINTTDLYRLILYSAPNGTEIRYRVDNISTGNSTSGVVTTNLPASATFLTQQAWITNNATAAAAALDIAKIYVELAQ